MRVNFLLALVVATYAATCISVSTAENVAQITDVEANEAQFLGGDNAIRRLKGSHELTSAKEWWVSEASDEERALPGMDFVTKLKGRVNAKKMQGMGSKVDTLSSTQVKEVTKATAKVVKKDRRVWPYIKKFLKILYGATLTAFIYVGVTAMLD
ncbi:hypothetical protein PF002_g32049 [Phytophthora fragariae]|uniref:RxLR effector protein n=1 Tax=Phytophthora fragariae TaxID=53985 RepID=A0A6A3DBU1_9STRA|nr:hypothetical protein PF003_g7455 [Phytophthora fragariae]KAE8917713.1 hypothetical protein PF009_g31968 [Phytophthora fragariae]KAE9162666.1 hypothetical protein PF002_g32049 [Phytophthora fragariae]KAE9269590.1 hypothetical protein PF001_g29156 [Phytophthora fragariae]